MHNNNIISSKISVRIKHTKILPLPHGHRKCFWKILDSNISAPNKRRKNNRYRIGAQTKSYVNSTRKLIIKVAK